MSDDDTSEDQLRSEAVDWVQRLDSGRATPGDLEALKQWCARSPVHEAAFREAGQLWKNFVPATRNLRARGELPAALAPRQPDVQPVFSRRMVLSGGLAAASAAVAYTVVHPPLNLWPSFAELTADYRTSTGEQRELALSNNVSVYLNTQTSVALEASDESVYRVELVAGEASFVSQPQQKRQLAVVAADGTTVARNAHFDIRRIDRSVCVTCIDGSVSVEGRSSAVTLALGQQVRYDQSGMGSVVPADVELVSAWRQGVLIFRSTPLSEVVDEINRYRSGKVILLDRNLAQKAISGRFRIDHIDDILFRLNQAFGLNSHPLPGGIVLLS
ncbi:MAG TPA: FecR domain-containing protein [Bradyrhizobium sp.]|nr:FecR domain-containing protein [Bradyrhizobium sp.]